ncbi:hypothetical protein GCM10023183_09720 [Nibribacter koreensis]|uniref:Por secretion system C-terminal sorting domain-containing protein n=2 Tax=Nibribacter koreensis TaxID=1084519 RepID=A0ABP8FC93_9BACT
MAKATDAYASAGLPAPTVTSDKDDYAPGEIAHITGTGWTLDQQVHVEFKEEPDYPDYHEYDVTVNSDGTWRIDYQVELRHIGVKFTVLAVGKASAYKASHVFTDANTSLSDPTPTSGAFGSAIILSSKLTQQGAGSPPTYVGQNNPIPNRRLSFKLGGIILGTGQTKSDGEASLAVVLTQNVGSYSGGAGLEVSFSGDPGNIPYAGQTKRVNFTITKANPVFSNIQGSGSYGGLVTLTAKVSLNIEGLPISFSVGEITMGTSNTNSNGVAVLTIPFANLPSFIKNANSYNEVLTVSISNSSNYFASSGKGDLIISPAPATISISDLTKKYNGGPQGATVETMPAGLPVSVTYEESTAIPTNAGIYKIDATITDPNYTAEVQKGTLTIGTADLKVEVDPQSKVYGTENPVLTGKMTGLMGSDVIPVSYSTTAVKMSDVTESGYPITATLNAAQELLNNYSITNTPSVLTITKAVATISVQGYEGEYDGLAHGATGTALGIDNKPISGLQAGVSFINVPGGTAQWTFSNPNFTNQNGEVAIKINKATVTPVWVAGTLAQTYDGLVKTVAATTTPSGLTLIYDFGDLVPKDANSYPVSVTVQDDNYEGFTTGTLVVAKANQAISFALIESKTFGDEAFAISPSTSSGLPVAITTSGNISYDAGTGKITINGAGPASVTAAQAGNGNYNAATSVTHDFMVNKANQTITVTTHAPSSAVYQTNFMVAATASSGLEVSYQSDGKLSNIGSTFTMTSGTGSGSVRYSQPGNANYNPATVITEIVNAEKAEQTITVVTALPASAVYNTGFTVAATATSGLNVVYGSTGALSNAGANYTMNSGTGTGVVTYNQPGDDNYLAAPEVTAAVTAQKAIATIALAAGDLSQTYNGVGKAVGYSTSPTGLNGVNIIYSQEGHSVTSPTNAGSYLVQASLSNDNYSGSAAGTLVIAKAATVLELTASNATYNGSEKGALANVTGAGGLNQPVTVYYEGVAPTSYAYSSTAPVNAGRYSATATYPESENHLPSSASKTFTIDKAIAAVVVSGYEGTYNGKAHGATGSATGVNNEALEGLELGDSFTNVPGGTARWTFSNPNYTSQTGEVAVKINKAPVTLVLGNLIHTYDGTLKSATVTATPNVSGVTVSGAGTDAGDYAAAASLSNDNYEADPVSGTLKIAKAATTTLVTIPAGPYTYTGSGITPATVSVTGPGGLNQNPEAAYANNINAGTATASYTFPESANYLSSSDTKTFTIGKATSTTVVTITGSQFTYSGLAQTPATVSVTGAGNLNLSPTASYQNNMNAGTATASFTYAGDDNHFGSSDSKTFDIAQAALSITPHNQAKYCGQVNPPLTVTYTGFVNNETASVLGGSLSIATLAHVNSGKGFYDITASGVTSGNYAITFNKGTLTVGEVAIDASASGNPVPVGSSATLSAVVSSSTDGSKLAGVLVVFKLDNVEKGTAVTNADGVATLQVSGLSVNVYKVEASTGSGCGLATAYLPVYDPTGGFVTGGGWINSPVGALAGSEAVGKANFGFVSKYKKGTNTVEGNTEFQFAAGSVNFKSSSHAAGTLVIAGSKATYKGTGFVNGGTDLHEFMVVATDGQVTGGGGSDKFRIKIWKKGGPVVYDNEKGTAENAELSSNTILGGGSIVIHEAVKGNVKPSSVVALENQPTAKGKFISYPNPFSDKVTFEFAFDQDDEYSLLVYSMNGALVKSIANSKAQANTPVQVQWGDNSVNVGVYIVRLVTSKGTQTLRVVRK